MTPLTFAEEDLCSPEVFQSQLGSRYIFHVIVLTTFYHTRRSWDFSTKKPSPLVKQVSNPSYCSKIFNSLSHPNHKSQEPETLKKCSLAPVWYVTHVMCHVSHVRCQLSGVTYSVSNETSTSHTEIAREQKFGELVQLLTPDMCHTSYFMCQVTHDRCRMSDVMCQVSHIILFFFLQNGYVCQLSTKSIESIYIYKNFLRTPSPQNFFLTHPIF